MDDTGIYHLCVWWALGAKSEVALIQILVTHKIDLLFNRQLRIHRANEIFEVCFQRTNALSIPAMLPVWKTIIGLAEHTYLAKMVLHLSLENFYLQITDQTLTEPWPSSYFASIWQMVGHFRQWSPKALLDSTVYKIPWQGVIFVPAYLAASIFC